MVVREWRLLLAEHASSPIHGLSCRRAGSAWFACRRDRLLTLRVGRQWGLETRFREGGSIRTLLCGVLDLYFGRGQGKKTYNITTVTANAPFACRQYP